MSTIDSLIKFKYKKKFSFSNKETSDDNDDNGDNKNEAQVESAEESDLESNKKKFKGSAKLKAASESESSDSDSDDSVIRSKSKRKKNAKKKDKNYSSEEEEAKREKNLVKLIRMFPHVSSDHIRKLFKSNRYDAKSCIDILLKEKENINEVNGSRSRRVDSGSSSPEIDEWSDGNEDIRQRNRLNRERKRRPSDDKLSGDSARPKSRKVIVVESDDDDDNHQESSGKIKKVPGSLSSNSPKNDSLSSDKSSDKPAKKKKTVLHSSSDEEAAKRKLSDSEEKKSSKKKKDKKKKKKKHRAVGSDEENYDDGGDDFNRNDDSADSGDTSGSDEFNYSDFMKTAIFNVLNKSSFDDIQSMINISAKKLEKLISLRPFKSFPHMRNQLKENTLGMVLHSVKEVLDARDVVNSLFEKCEKISEKMKQKVESLIESEGCDDKKSSSVMEIKSQPSILNNALTLKPYQLIGLNWLCLMHKERLNAILADEMGLGKTCQTIAFLAYLLEHSKESKDRSVHLIVVPPSTLDNWVREISTWCPDFYFTVYQGSLEERKHLRYNILNNKFEKPLNGIVTTYNLLISTNEDKAFVKKLNIGYVIYDEAHMLKNMNSIRYKGLMQINSKGRLLLTGTPLQNNLVELMSLLYFVMPNIFKHSTEHIRRIFSTRRNTDNDTFYMEKINQAKGIMKPFILRRVKDDVLKQLPKKSEEIIFCDMNARQEKEYNKLLSFYKNKKDELMKEINRVKEELAKQAKEINEKTSKQDYADEILEIAGSSSMNSANARADKNKKAEVKKEGLDSSNIIMELRKCANHPLLKRVIYNDDKIKEMAKLIMRESSPGTVYEYVVEDMSVLNDFEIHKLCASYRCLKGYELGDSQILESGKMVILESILDEKKEQGDRVLIFSQFVIVLDILEEFLKIKSYKYLRLDGNTPINERQDMIDYYNHNSEVLVFLLSTRAGGVGINLTAANVVIMHDIDFNPYNDKQAEDRCHRVGQTKEVQVYKLISKNSIEETMLKIQQKKIDLGVDLNGGKETEKHTKNDVVSLLKEALKI